MTKLYQPDQKLAVLPGIFLTGIKGLWYLERKSFADERGFFAEIAYMDKIGKVSGRPFVIKQVNHSRSSQHVVRGMHAEDWRKLITVTSGAAFCALADVRPDSATFSQTVCFNLGIDDGGLRGSLFVEEGVANSFCVVSGAVDYFYCVDRLYTERNLQGDVAISLFDPDLNIKWPLAREQMILSKRDKNSVTLRERFPEKFKGNNK